MKQPVPIFETDLTLSTSIYSTGWHLALTRPPKIDVHSVPLAPSPPRSLTVTVRRQIIKTFEFSFAQSSWPLDPAPPGDENEAFGRIQSGSPDQDATHSRRRKCTRIKPPGDIIKLEDRLFYLLQPPLESLLTVAALRVPFEPFPYQFEGVGFLYPRFSAILADEMGLGKTMQAITTIRLLLRAAEIRTVLLICPKPLVTNWQREFSLWAPEVPVTVIGGDQHRRRWQWNLPGMPVKIANYEVVVRDSELIGETKASFDLVVLDEAQRVKNRHSATSQAVRSVTRRRSWALTGTPVENSHEDLVGIFEFLSPGYLSAAMTPRQMGLSARDYVLRRTKDEVLTDLPPKLFRDAEIDLSPEQRNSYDLAESEGVLRLTEIGDGLTIQHVFELVLRLKQICNFDPATSASSKVERLLADLEEVAASGQKAIIFSQWVETIKRLSDQLQRFGPLQFHGRIPSNQRDAVIARFRDDPQARVMLMSYGAGSVGLNLQFAGYVFLFDRWWNPAVEDQAINRAHRIGAAGPVTVSRFLTLGTIEERIEQVLQEKRNLFHAIFSQTRAARSFGLSQEEIFGLFGLKTPREAVQAVA